MPILKTFTWKDPRPITVAVIGVMAMDVVWAVFGIVLYAVWQGIGASPQISPATPVVPRMLVLLYGLLSIVVLLNLPVAVFWILRVSKNAHVLKGRSLANSPLFAALWWYIMPFMWFFKPLEAMMEIWDVSAATHERRQRHRRLFWLWWGATLIGAFMGYVVAAFNRASTVLIIQLIFSCIQCVSFAFIARLVCDMQVEKQLVLAFSDEPDRPMSVLERLNV